MTESSLPPFDLVVGGVPRFRAEAPWAWRLLSRYLRGLPAAHRVEGPGRDLVVSDVDGAASLVLVHADPEAYLLPEVGVRLLAALAAHPETALVLPVSNESDSEETRRAPPFAYVTPTLLAEAVEFLGREAAPLRPVPAASSPVYAIRREALRALPPDLALRRVPEQSGAYGLSAAVDPGAYVHRYGAMDASAREDLAARVPPGARSVLDVGCSRGATASALRERGVERIVGIEPDPEDAEAAALRYDEVLTSRLEDAALRERFDAILFGDVLEHLEDPSDALVRVRPWLAPAGVLIASVPNVGHWAIIDDLLRGRFDYVPYSLLSGTHVRFFTRRTLEDLFEASGYRVTSIETMALPTSPLGEARLARLRAFPSASADLDVSEFLAVARSG
jgi:2-polyprenyl-3-methyl-5-hydroxy-6-metoxy-1,4-benzoquinol methylase